MSTVPAEVVQERKGLVDDAREDGQLVTVQYGKREVDPATSAPVAASPKSAEVHAFARSAETREVRGGLQMGDQVVVLPWASLPAALQVVAEKTLGGGDPTDWTFTVSGHKLRAIAVLSVGRLQGHDLAYTVAGRGGRG